MWAIEHIDDTTKYIRGLNFESTECSPIEQILKKGDQSDYENGHQNDDFKIQRDTLVSPVIKIPHCVTLAVKPPKLLILDMFYAKHARSLEKVFYPK